MAEDPKVTEQREGSSAPVTEDPKGGEDAVPTVTPIESDTPGQPGLPNTVVPDSVPASIRREEVISTLVYDAPIDAPSAVDDSSRPAIENEDPIEPVEPTKEFSDPATRENAVKAEDYGTEQNAEPPTPKSEAKGGRKASNAKSSTTKEEEK
jgi:hypothetical protein